MKLKLEIDGTDYLVEAQNIRGQIWIHLNGRNFSYEPADKKSAKRSKKTGHAGDLTALMPGKVTKIFKQVNDIVKQGEAVLVMEAMKMEYTLKADGDGIVEKINCQVGEQVQLGKLLVHIKPKMAEA